MKIARNNENWKEQTMIKMEAKEMTGGVEEEVKFETGNVR